MTIVLVHGNPETAAVWTPLVAALGSPGVVRLSPPGFGAPVPPGWRATPEAYRNWLTDELQALGSPVDLVGHDWGGAHVVNVAMTRPDLLRSWSADSIGWFEPDYAWHALARTWQTPGAGESAVAAMTDPALQRRAAYLASIGVPGDVTDALAPGCGEVSGQCVLELYRSARQPKMADLGRDLPAAGQRPGLILLATEDQGTGTEAMRRRAAARADARIEVLPGLGHWWMRQDPHHAAALLGRFWSALSNRPDHPQQSR